MESAISRKSLEMLSKEKQLRKFHDFGFLLNIDTKDLCSGPSKNFEPSRNYFLCATSHVGELTQGVPIWLKKFLLGPIVN